MVRGKLAVLWKNTSFLLDTLFLVGVRQIGRQRRASEYAYAR